MVATIKCDTIKEATSLVDNLVLDGSGNVTIGNNLTVTGSTTQTGPTTFTGQLLTSAGTAGAPAIARSGDADNGIFFPATNTVAIATAGTEDMRFTPEGNVTLNSATFSPTTPGTAGNMAMTGTLAMGSSFLRNRIINGAFAIDQRNAGAAFSNTTGNAYTLDRWISQSVGSVCTVQQVTGSTGNNNALRVTGASGNSTTIISQRIEAINIFDLASQTVTVSFTIYGSVSGSVSVRFLYPTATNNYASTTEPVAGTTVNFTTTATRYTVTRVLSADANKGLWLVFDRGATGAGVTWSLEDIQIEQGSVATPFERRLYGTELALCQRYYQVVIGGVVDDVISGTTYGSFATYLVTPRAAPTVTWLNSQSAFLFPTTASTISNISTTGFLNFKNANSTGNGGNYLDNFTVSAEL